jgi:hypothetical protein
MESANTKINRSWRLEENIDLHEAQFLLADFCLDHFPENMQFARAIQNTSSASEIRAALKPVINMIQTRHIHLAEEFTTMIYRINKTTE